MSDAPPGQRRRAALPEGMTPRFLSVDEAAAYVGVSRDLFLTEVEHGFWPPARRRGGGEDKAGRRLTWDCKALDAAADIASGLTAPTPQAAADARQAAERIALMGVANGPAPIKRNQSRQAKAA